MLRNALFQRTIRLRALVLYGSYLARWCFFVLVVWSQVDGRDVLFSDAEAQEAVSETVRQVNVPYTDSEDGTIPVLERAIFWFGEVGTNENFTDVRIIYDDAKLLVTLHIYDRLLWYKPNPLTGELTDWDAATLYLQANDQPENGNSSTTFQFIGQLSLMSQPRNAYQSAYRLDGATWVPLSPGSFETTVGTQMSGVNDLAADRGWNVTFDIPFNTVGLEGPPPKGATWRMALVTHDRDSLQPTTPNTQQWPEEMLAAEPSTWGELSFGLPVYQTPLAIRDGTSIIRHGLNGSTVVDSHAGGGMVCGGDIEPGGSSWPTWGNHNRGGTHGVNVQNQWNLGDWPCFSKYYVTFPLTQIPAGTLIISATLTLHQFGNSGQPGFYASDTGPQPSLIQVLTVAEDWSEGTLTWNNAPLAKENVSRAWVDPLPPLEDRPEQHVARHWNVSGAVAEAYLTGQPLRLALYSADSSMHSGKYFRSSEFHDPSFRPALKVSWGHPLTDPYTNYLPLLAEN